MKRHLALLASSILLASPLAALARDAFTVDEIGLQAGPDDAYPTITQLPAGTEVALQGCIDGWTWCDVIAGRDRGWVPASYLEEEYDNQRVLVVDYGPRIGIPVVSFSLGAYWDRHYHDRPWYHERASWESRHIEPRAMPRPTQASRGGAELRAHAQLSAGEAHGGSDRQRPDARAYDEHAGAASRHQSAAAQQSTASSSRTNAQTSAHATTRADDAGASNTQTPSTAAAQGDVRMQHNGTPQGHDSALGAEHRMPPQVQTARNNTPQARPHAQAHDEAPHERGKHDGDTKDRDHDRDRDHE